MVDPMTIISNLSWSLISFLGKIGGKLFRKPELSDYIDQISFEGSLEDAISIRDIPEIDVSAIDHFLHTAEIKNMAADIYSDSGDHIQDVEYRFTQDFCNLQLIEGAKCEEVGKKIFSIFKRDLDELINSKILNGELIAFDYRSSEKIKKLTSGQVQILDRLKIDDIGYVDEELKESVSLIKQCDYETAKIKITALLGILESDTRKNKKILSKAYHLLGVIYNRIPEFGGDFEKAERYLLQSGSFDYQNYKARAVLASLYLNKGGKENFKKAYKLIKLIWDNQKDPQVLEVLLWSICFYKSSKDAIEFFEASKEAQDIVEENDILLNVVARLYVDIKKFELAIKFINDALRLNSESPNNIFIKGSIFLNKGLLEDIMPSDFELVPKLKKIDCIEYALLKYLAALKCEFTEGLIILQQEIRFSAYFCSILLNRQNETEFRNIREDIDITYLSEYDRKRIEFLDFIKIINERRFFEAYSALVGLSDWNKFSYGVKLKFAKIFLKRGSPEEAKKILKSMEDEAKTRKDIQYWLDLSFNEALLGNKSNMIQALNAAKSVSSGTSHEEIVFFHTHMMLNRYIEEEIDRIISLLHEHDIKFPNNRLLIPIKAIGEDGKTTPEILELIDQQRKGYERIKEAFHSLCVPTYILEKLFSRPYAQILSSMNDPDFWINYYAPTPSFTREMGDNFEESMVFIFDYSSLLNLSKMGLLGELERINKRKFITKSLFDKVQYELLLYENQDLRDLWDYLRNSNDISIIDIDADLSKYETIASNLEKWIIDTIELASTNEKIVIFGDDLNFLKLLKEFKIKGCISFLIINDLFENSFIDVKIRALCIGNLAERFYIFLPFDGEDLLIIVMNDDCKITLRTYHLINQIILPDVHASGYTSELSYFTDKLWKSGALLEDKKIWLKFLTSKILVAIENSRNRAQRSEADLLKFDLIQIWRVALDSGKISESELIETEIPELFNKDMFSDIESEIRQMF